MEQKLVLFNSSNGDVSINVAIEKESVWLTQQHIELLFERDQSVISRHIANVFKEELDKKSNMQKMHIANSDKPVTFYNLDVIISIGYRVKSKRGIEFRQWANKVLKEYLLKGYAVNQNLIDVKTKEYQMALDLLSRTLVNNNLVIDAGFSVISIINNYARTWSTLLQYDEDKLLLPDSVHKHSKSLEYADAIAAISKLKAKLSSISEATELFGNERSQQLQSILGNLEQTMFGEELYKSVEEKAANLLYMVIKDHPFSDGNKRIGSFLFLFYVQSNSLPLNIDQIGLTALTLLIAESNPNQKNLMIRLIVNFLAQKE